MSKKAKVGSRKKRNVNRGSETRDREIYVEELAKADIAFQIGAALHESGMTQKGLAEKLGVSEARISQLLDAEGSNFTLRTLARVAVALECELGVAMKRGVVYPKALTEHVDELQNLLPAVDGDSAPFIEQHEAPKTWRTIVAATKTRERSAYVDWTRDAANEVQYDAA